MSRPHKAQKKRQLGSHVEGKIEKKQPEKENKVRKQRKEENQEITGLFLGSIYSQTQ